MDTSQMTKLRYIKLGGVNTPTGKSNRLTFLILIEADWFTYSTFSTFRNDVFNVLFLNTIKK